METQPVVDDQEPLDTAFFPKGAIAFFSLMLGSFVVVWLFIYALMIYRAT